MQVDNTRSKDVLGIRYTDIKDSFVDMGFSLIEQGYVPGRHPSDTAARCACHNLSSFPSLPLPPSLPPSFPPSLPPSVLLITVISLHNSTDKRSAAV